MNEQDREPTAAEYEIIATLSAMLPTGWLARAIRFALDGTPVVGEKAFAGLRLTVWRSEKTG